MYTFLAAVAPYRNFARCKIHFASSSLALSYLQCYCMAVEQWARAKLCGVEHRAPPIFGRATIWLSNGPHFSSFFLAYSQRPQIGCLPYFHTWCGLSANLECMSEMYVARWKCRTQKIPKNSPSGRTTLLSYIFATKACIDNWIKLAKQQYLPHMSLQYGEPRPTSNWDRFISLWHPN